MNVIERPTQICSKCKQPRLLSLFRHRHEKGRKHELRSQCKLCENEYKKTPTAYRKANAASKRRHMLDPRRRMLKAARCRAKRLDVPFDLTKEDILVPSLCPILGIPISSSLDQVPVDETPSLDRIVPELGYIKCNVRVISFRANTIKNSGSLDEHRLVSDYIERECSKFELLERLCGGV